MPTVKMKTLIQPKTREAPNAMFELRVCFKRVGSKHLLGLIELTDAV